MSENLKLYAIQKSMDSIEAGIVEFKLTSKTEELK